MILHHRHVLKGCGSTNQILSVLVECADNEKIVDVNQPLVPHFEVLLLWSKRLEDNWGGVLKLGGVEGSLEISIITHIAKDLIEVK